MMKKTVIGLLLCIGIGLHAQPLGLSFWQKLDNSNKDSLCLGYLLAFQDAYNLAQYGIERYQNNPTYGAGVVVGLGGLSTIFNVKTADFSKVVTLVNSYYQNKENEYSSLNDAIAFSLQKLYSSQPK